MVITRKFLGDWAIYDFKDADIWRIIYGDQIGYSKKMVEDRRSRGTAPKFKEILVNRDQRWSLKYTAQKYLNVGSWDNDFEAIESKLWVIFNGYQHDNVDHFLRNPIVGHLFHSWVEDEIFSEMEMTKLLKSLSAWKKLDSMDTVRDLFPVEHMHLAEELRIVLFGCKTTEEVKEHVLFHDLLDAYPESEDEFIKLFNNPKYFGNPFSAQPSEIVGSYCVIDSYYTLMIAERHLREDYFTRTDENEDRIPAKWMTTEKMINIFNGNKALGSKLSMLGLYKSNTRRDKYNGIQLRARVHSNYVLALAYYQLLLSADDLIKHKDEDLLHPMFKSVIEFNGNPLDFGRVTKVLFPLIYNPECEKGWDDVKAEKYLGDLAEEIKQVLLDHKPGGFVNASAHSRALNLHKETALIVEEAWNDQDLPEGFDWKELRKYYDDANKLKKSQDILDKLETCNIKGKHINDLMEMENFEIDGKTYTFREGITVMKKEYYDCNANNEVILGVLTERWKDYKTLLFLYHPQEYKSIIDDLGIWEEGFTITQKVNSFTEYMKMVIGSYTKTTFDTWESARAYARGNDYPEDLQNPVEEDMQDYLQSNAYLDKMLSHDLMLKKKVSLGLMNQFVWYQMIEEDDIVNKKAWMLDVKHASPMCYKNWMECVPH